MSAVRRKYQALSEHVRSETLVCLGSTQLRVFVAFIGC